MASSHLTVVASQDLAIDDRSRVPQQVKTVYATTVLGIRDFNRLSGQRDLRAHGAVLDRLVLVEDQDVNLLSFDQYELCRFVAGLCTIVP